MDLIKTQDKGLLDMDLINPIVGGDVKPNTGHHENKYSPLALIHQTQTLHHNTTHHTTQQNNTQQ
jgi:hypothetical protein